jgi:hypothetical protein
MYEQQEPNGSFNKSQFSPLVTNKTESRHAADAITSGVDAPGPSSSCQNGICSLDWKPTRPA